MRRERVAPTALAKFRQRHAGCKGPKGRLVVLISESGQRFFVEGLVEAGLLDPTCKPMRFLTKTLLAGGL